MTTFFLAFGLFLLVIVGMALGVIFQGKKLKGSCGGLNAVAGADHCLVCHKPIDPDSPLRDRLTCGRAVRGAKQQHGRAVRGAKQQHGRAKDNGAQDNT